MNKLVPLEAWHIEILYSNGEIDPAIYSPGYASFLAKHSIGVTLLVDDEVKGCGGIMPLWTGVGDGWALVTDWLRDHPVLLTKAFKRFILDHTSEFKRVQITVEESFEKAQAFAEFLGFTPEGRMEYYSPTGDTHLRYARII